MREPLDSPVFNGKVELVVRDSASDWSPNALFVLYDDTGLRAWSPYGGKVNMPTPDDLAVESLT